MIGRIQLGASAARYPNVMLLGVPDGVPAAGIAPIEPGCVVTPGEVLVFVGLVLLLLLLLLLHAARAVMPATARASPPMYLLPNLVIAPPSLRHSQHWSVLGSSACRPSLSQFAGDPLRHRLGGHWVAILPIPVRPVSPAHPGRPMTGRPVSYRCYELAEA